MNTKYHSMAEHFITYFAFNASLTLFNFFDTFPLILHNFNVHLRPSPPSSIMAFAMNIYLWFGRCDVITMTTLKWMFEILGCSLYFWYLIKSIGWIVNWIHQDFTLNGLAPIWTVRLCDIAIARELKSLPQILHGVEDVGRCALKMWEFSLDLWWKTFPHCSHTWLPPASCLQAIWTCRVINETYYCSLTSLTLLNWRSQYEISPGDITYRQLWWTIKTLAALWAKMTLRGMPCMKMMSELFWRQYG